MLLGGIKTKRAIHVCRGHFQCSHADPALFTNYEHYDNDFRTFEELHNTHKANNAAEGETVVGIVTA